MKLETLWHGIKPYVPRQAHPVLKETYWRLTWYWHTRFTALPPAPLRWRVAGSSDIEAFLDGGRQCSQVLRDTLGAVQREWASFEHILDFGCGCGRMLVWLAQDSRSGHLYGTDIDAEAIAWCRNHLRFATFTVNQPLPPLDYPADRFDLIYAMSVFTHLDEDYQFRWLSELRRLTRPGGLVLATVLDADTLQTMRPRRIADVDRALAEAKKAGFLYVVTNTCKGVLPDYYQSTFHTREYVLDRFARYFDILRYLPRAMLGFLDLVVLRKA
jgi:SAM-dependent methyltransferase